MGIQVKTFTFGKLSTVTILMPFNKFSNEKKSKQERRRLVRGKKTRDEGTLQPCIAKDDHQMKPILPDKITASLFTRKR